MVNELLQEAFNQAAKLSEDEQTSLAEWILDEIDDMQWQKRFKETIPQLQKLARKAREEYRAGLSEPLDPDTLGSE